ncbi:MAG TPA: hypothetical protein VGH38_35220 [Bryobacteraceae bacterium]
MKSTLALTFALALAGGTMHAERLANGLEFRTPNGWTAKTNEQAAILVPPDMAMEPGGKDPSELYVVALLPGVRDLEDPQLASIVRGQYFPAQAQVRPSGAAQPFRAAAGTGYLHRLTAVSEGVVLGVNIYVVALPGGVAGVMAIGRPGLIARRETLVEGVAASLSRQASAVPTSGSASAPPAPNGTLASQWEQRLRGHKLYQFSGYSSGYGSGGYNSQKTLRLAANGAYQFQRSGSVSVYVPGASGGSASQSGMQGRWRIYEQGGQAILELVAATGAMETIVLTANGSQTMLNGHRWLVGD